jgi:hypothetical protein
LPKIQALYLELFVQVQLLDFLAHRCAKISRQGLVFPFHIKFWCHARQAKAFAAVALLIFTSSRSLGSVAMPPRPRTKRGRTSGTLVSLTPLNPATPAPPESNVRSALAPVEPTLPRNEHSEDLCEYDSDGVRISEGVLQLLLLLSRYVTFHGTHISQCGWKMVILPSFTHS